MGRRKTGLKEKAARPTAEASPEPEGWSFALDDELLIGRWPEPATPDSPADSPAYSPAASSAEPAATPLVMQPLRLPAAARASAAAKAPAPASPAVVAQVEILAAPPAPALRATQPRPQTVQVVAAGTVQTMTTRPSPRSFGVTPLRAAAQPVIGSASGQWPGRAQTGSFGIFESDTLVFKEDAETG